MYLKSGLKCVFKTIFTETEPMPTVFYKMFFGNLEEFLPKLNLPADFLKKDDFFDKILRPQMSLKHQNIVIFFLQK